MNYIIALLSYGDCLITLSLLERLGGTHGAVEVLGTDLTQRVAALMRRPPPITSLLPDMAAFYRVRAAGPANALSDTLAVRRALAARASGSDTLAFERCDLRTRLIAPRVGRRVFSPSGGRVYADRLAWLCEVLGEAPPWPAPAAPRMPIRRVLVNPCARSADRWLSPRTVDALVGLAGDMHWDLTLLDPCGGYAPFSNKVSGYLSHPPLDVVAAALRAADLYVGPDSFFIHLAYYYGVPFFGVFLSHHHDFLVPGMEVLGNFCDYDIAADPARFRESLLRFARPAAAHDNSVGTRYEPDIDADRRAQSD